MKCELCDNSGDIVECGKCGAKFCKECGDANKLICDDCIGYDDLIAQDALEIEDDTMDIME